MMLNQDSKEHHSMQLFDIPMYGLQRTAYSERPLKVWLSSQASFIDGCSWHICILVVTQFRSHGDLFGRLIVPRATDCMEVWTNRIIVTSQMSHHISELRGNKDMNTWAEFVFKDIYIKIRDRNYINSCFFGAKWTSRISLVSRASLQCSLGSVLLSSAICGLHFLSVGFPLNTSVFLSTKKKKHFENCISTWIEDA